MKGGCLHGGNLSRTPTPKFRGVQVFTYRELEVATDGFSQANVIGSGRFGLMYRGVLSDGTLAAIKLLSREGKHGERAFRIEVSEAASFNDIISLFVFLVLVAVCSETLFLSFY